MTTSSSSSRREEQNQAHTFSLFSQLAPELRLKIWQHARPTRTLSIRYDPSTDTISCPSQPPALLHTCRESRTEALRCYSLLFGTRTCPAHTYFDPTRDTLYLPRHRPMGYDETLRDLRDFLCEDEKGVLDQVQSIAIDHVDAVVKRPWESYNKASMLRGFPALKEVLLVLGGDVGERGVGSVVKEFRQSVVAEESVLEDVCRAMGREYVKWTLPNVSIRRRRELELDG